MMRFAEAPDLRRRTVSPFEGLPGNADGWAIFLDFDGTLVDIAVAPSEVKVPPDLPRLLERVRERAGGALAILTGRPIAVIDSFLAPLRLPMGGIHGAEIRFPDGSRAQVEPSAAHASVRAELSDFVAQRPGLALEDKGLSLAVHYRRRPDLAGEVATKLAALAEAAGDLVAQHGKMVVELRPLNGVKDEGLQALLARAPFAGRRPIAIGDDLNDEPMFAAANARDGLSVLVGGDGRETEAVRALAGPAEVRAWLASLLDG